MHIKLIDKINEKEVSFKYDGGVSAFVSYLNCNKIPLNQNIIYICGKRNNVDIEVAMQWNDSYQENIFLFY